MKKMRIIEHWGGLMYQASSVLGEPLLYILARATEALQMYNVHIALPHSSVRSEAHKLGKQKLF